MSRRTYVDNAYNRSIGRVGMSLGSAVVSKSYGSYSSSSFSGSGSGTYVDNSSNRSLGRVGLPLGSAVHSRSSGETNQVSTSSRTYVDNAQNRSLGRVGLPLGSAVHSRLSGETTEISTSSATYVDNAQNRSLGRVGLPLGSAVHSRSASGPSGHLQVRSYVDNAFNRRLGRVGLPLGSAVQSRSSGKSTTALISNSTGLKTYVDNAHNRKLGRVGLPLGSAVEVSSKNPCNNKMENLKKLMLDTEIDHQQLWEQLQCARFEAINNEDHYNCDQFEGILNRRDAAIVQRRSGKKTIKYEGHIIDYAELEIGDKIGNGGFADVHIAMWKNEFTVAVKKLRVQRVSQKRKAEFENEIQLLATLKHRTIVTFYGACVETPNLAIVMEFMSRGSLHDIIFCETIQLTDKQKESMITDVLIALDYIHTRKISHRDIKSRNILVDDNLTNCKLTDFGLALNNYTETSASVNNIVGTVKYSAPEILNGDHLTTTELMAADVYSMALTIVELISEEEPFDNYNVHQIRKAVLAGKTPSLDDVSDMLKPLLSACLGKAKQRPVAANLLSRYLDLIDDSDRDL